MNRESQSIVMVTHDLKSAIRGNRILYLRDGIIVGELDFEKYEEEPEKLTERKETLMSFLEEMEW